MFDKGYIQNTLKKLTEKNFATVAEIIFDTANLLRPPPPESVAEGMARVMLMKFQDGVKPFSFERTPYMIEPCNLLQSKQYTELVFMGCARTGKSESLVKGWAAYSIAVTKEDMMIIHLTEAKALEFSKKELKPMIERSPLVRAEKTGDANDFTNNDLIFKSGNSILVKWPTKNNLASTTVQNIVFTDFDRLPRNIDSEGDPWQLGKKRTATYGISAMAVAESSPGFNVLNPDQKLTGHDCPDSPGIAALYNQGTKHCYYWPCKSCGEYFWASPSCIWWDESLQSLEEKAESSRIKCPNCGTLHTTAERNIFMFPRGKWLADGQKIDKLGNISGKPRKTRTASFWLRAPACAFNSLYQIVKELLQAEEVYKKTGDENQLKAVYNTTLGEPYTTRVKSSINEDSFARHVVETFKLGEAPRDTLFLCACVDVQAGSEEAGGAFVVHIIGISTNQTIYLVDRFLIDQNSHGDVIRPSERSHDWEILRTKVLDYKATVVDMPDKVLGVHKVIIDSGGYGRSSNCAYDFWEGIKKDGLASKVLLVKGAGSKSIVTRESTAGNSQNIPLLLINSTYFKNILFNLLEQKGAVEFPQDTPPEVFKELAAETWNPVKQIWELPHPSKRNESLDLFVYFLGFLNRYRIREKIERGSSVYYLLPLEHGNPYLISKDELESDELSSMKRLNRRQQYKYAKKEPGRSWFKR